MRVLTGSEISSLLRNLSHEDARTLLNALSSGLASYSRQKNATNEDQTFIQPQRTVMKTRENNTVLTMPVSDTESTVVKVATVPGQGDIAGAITIYNSVGDLLGVLNAAEITAFRTALATMTILTRWPAPENTSCLVFGSGKQAEWHVRLALLLIPGIQKVTVVNRGRARLDELEHGLLSELGKSYPKVDFQSFSKQDNAKYDEDLKQTLAEADIVSGCTPSTEPLFTYEDLQRNATKRRFISLIGSYKPEMQEVDAETIRHADTLYVDLVEACLDEAGELIRAKLQPEDLVEIGKAFSNELADANAKIDGNASLTLFKCVGFGLMDLVISKALLDMAETSRRGIVVERF